MRLLLLASLAGSVAFAAAEPLAIVRPVISQVEDSTPPPTGTYYIPGQSLFFTCRVAHIVKGADRKIRVAYTVAAFDPKGVQLNETYRNEFTDEVTVEDADWMPRIQTQVSIPPLVGSGTYKVVVKAEDEIAKTTAEMEVPFEVHGHPVEPSDTVIVRNFHFFRDEGGKQPVENAVYHAGETLWARFDIIGYKFGEGNKVDVSYVASILLPGGRTVWTQKEPASEQSGSFYPKRYVSGEFSINLTAGVKPGAYIVGVQVKDAIGNQTYDARHPFTVE